MTYLRETSLDAYTSIKEDGLLTKREFQVYKCLFHRGPMTANDVIRYYQNRGYTGNQTGYNARFSVLERKGVIRARGTKKDPVSNRPCTLWDVTTNLPRKIEADKNPKKPTNFKNCIRHILEHMSKNQMIYISINELKELE